MAINFIWLYSAIIFLSNEEAYSNIGEGVLD